MLIGIGRVAIVTLLLIFVQSCGKNLESEIVLVKEYDNRYETERLSFLPPKNITNWEVVLDTFNDGFYSFVDYSTETRRFKVAVYSYKNRYEAKSWDEYVKEEFRQTADVKRLMKSGKYDWRVNFVSSKMLKKSGLICSESVVLSNIPNGMGEYQGGAIDGGGEMKISYTCTDPKNPDDLPPIYIYLWQAAAKGLKLYDPDEVLKPIFDSLIVKPVDKNTAPGYKKIMQIYAERDEARRQSRERARQKNEAK